MTFLENFEQQCRLRGESPSHALEASGLSKSLWAKWKKYPERMPYGDTVKKLADHFGCAFEDLETNGRAPKEDSDLFLKIKQAVLKLDDKQRGYLLSFIQFTFPETRE